MKVHSLFSSLQGEGRFQGYPSFFVRLYGCNLNCVYCDAVEAVSGDNYKEMSVDEIAAQVKRSGINDVCITGGEPLCQREELVKLISRLSNHRITLETNGSLDISGIEGNNVFFSVDWKTPGSGSLDFNEKNIDLLRKINGWIKFVVSNYEDLEFVEDKSGYLEGVEVFISPVFEKGLEFFKDTSEFVERHEGLRFQLQIHKILGIE
jgi:7-carboxy-7-deazaguanine synthase